MNNEVRVVTMTICLCHGGVCESCIRCSWPRTMDMELSLLSVFMRAVVKHCIPKCKVYV